MYRPRSAEEIAREEARWEPPARVVVDGEEFDAAAHRDQRGQYRFRWVSGPNPGHGFSVGTSHGREMSSAEVEDCIRDFRAAVDTETGYVE